MAIDVQCDYCRVWLQTPGALLFSPPTTKGFVYKRHLCATCHNALSRWLEKKVPFDDEERNDGE